MDQVRPYLIVGESHRARVADCARRCLRQWAEDWLARGIPIPEIVPLEKASAEHWILAGSDSLESVGIGYSKAWIDRAAGLFAGRMELGMDGSSGSDLATVVCETALEELAMLLGGENSRLDRRKAAPAEQMAVPGAGFVAFECRFDTDGGAIQIVGWPHWVASQREPHAGKMPPHLVSPAKALGSEAVLVSAIVGEAELPIGDFARLAVGDVLIVDRLLEEPFAVQVDGGDVFAGGHLCTSGGRKAIELISLDA